MKKLILPFVLGAMMVSCSRDSDDNAINPAETPVLLTKIVNTEEDGSIETTHFEYNGDKLVKIYGGYGAGSWSHEQIITYTGDLITSIKDKESNGDEGETIYTYDSQKRLKTVIETSRNNESVYTSTRNYTHNADGTVVVKETQKTDYINPNNADSEAEIIITYTVRNGLITKVENKEGEYTSTDVYTYDDKNAPFKNVRGIKEAMFEFFGEGAISVLPHNMISSEEGQDTFTYTYVYNDKNYPKKATVALPRGQQETYEYFYNK